ANYKVTFASSANGEIDAIGLTVTATGVNKQYDGTPSATVTLSDNRISGDVFTDSYTSASFADKNVETGKAVSVSGLSISGTDAGNYTLSTTTATTTANITVRPLTVSGTGMNKEYDGTASATVALSDNRISGDSLTDSYTSAGLPRSEGHTSELQSRGHLVCHPLPEKKKEESVTHQSRSLAGCANPH